MTFTNLKYTLDHNTMLHELCTQGYHVSDHFLPLEHYHALQQKVRSLEQQSILHDAKIGQKKFESLNQSVRTDKTCWLDEHAEDPAVQAYISNMNTITTLFNQELYLSLIELEAHFSVYPPGAFYKKHQDQFIGAKNRKISCVYYLNEDWEEHFGGTLRLYTNNEEFLRDVIPQGNRFICFQSDLPHEVLPTQRTRYSIAGWLKTR